MLFAVLVETTIRMQAMLAISQTLLLNQTELRQDMLRILRELSQK